MKLQRERAGDHECSSRTFRSFEEGALAILDYLQEKAAAFFNVGKYVSAATGHQAAGLRYLTPAGILAYGILLAIHIVLALLFLLDRSCGSNAALTGLPLDDSWIHFVYARSIAQTALPYFNTGQLEAGFTSPVWIGVLGCAELLARFLPISAILMGKLIGVLCGWFASIAIFELARRVISTWGISLLTGALLAAWPAFGFAQLSGMEVCLATAMSLWAVVAFADRRMTTAGVTLAISYLTRPETAVLVVVIVAVYLTTSAKDVRKTRAANIVRLTLPLAVAVAAWSAYCMVVSHHWLPNTFYAKSSGAFFMQSLANMLTGIVIKMPTMFVFGGLIAYLLGALKLTRDQCPSRGVILAYPWVFLLAVAGSRQMPSMCGDYFYWLRYALPALPFLLIPMMAGVAFVWQLPNELASSARMTKLLRGAAVALVLLLWASYPAALAEKRSQYAWNCQNINEVQVKFGLWAKRNLPKNAVVLVNDAGAIPYFGQRKTIDVMGLNDHQLLFNSDLHARISRDPDALADYMRLQGADYLIVFPTWYPDLINDRRFGKNFIQVTYFEADNYTITNFPQKTMYAFCLKRA